VAPTASRLPLLPLLRAYVPLLSDHWRREPSWWLLLLHRWLLVVQRLLLLLLLLLM
jgi:hypothetical protein